MSAMNTEAKKIEIARRWDEAMSLIPQATGMYIRADFLRKQISSLEKRMLSPWLWIPLLGGIGISFLLTGEFEWDWNWGTKLSALCLALHVFWAFEGSKASTRLNQVLDTLGELESVWRASVVYSDLYEIKQFIKDDYLDDYSDEYKKWKQAQRINIEARIGDHL